MPLIDCGRLFNGLADALGLYPGIPWDYRANIRLIQPYFLGIFF
jgi:hypothetical protein